MKHRTIIDLTHTISTDIPVYEGTERPRLTEACSYQEHGFRETLLHMYSHTGTHTDSPAHLFAGRTQLDEFDIAQFVGDALVIDCSELGAGDVIDFSHIERVKEKAERAEFLLFHTGWSERWKTESYFGAYPYPSAEIIDYIVKTGKKGIGIDTIGIDPMADKNLTIHKALLQDNEMIIIENLCNLDRVGNDLFLFAALPLKFKDSDGAPTRAIAITATTHTTE